MLLILFCALASSCGAACICLESVKSTWVSRGLADVEGLSKRDRLTWWSLLVIWVLNFRNHIVTPNRGNKTDQQSCWELWGNAHQRKQPLNNCWVECFLRCSAGEEPGVCHIGFTQKRVLPEKIKTVQIAMTAADWPFQKNATIDYCYFLQSVLDS